MDLLPNTIGNLPIAAFEEKHLPVRHSPKDWPKNACSTRNHFLRATAKRYAQNKGSRFCRDLGLTCTTLSSGTPTCHRCGQDNRIHPSQRRAQLEDAIALEVLRPTLIHDRDRIARNRIHFSRWCSDEVEGRDLAHSSISLPSDRFRLARKPTLEREDAFRDASTAKRNGRQGRSPVLTDDAEVAELYRMGLLYEDEQDRGANFNLDSIDHNEPVYSVRPAKRSRFSKKSHSFSIDKPLHLNLSFTDLGGDHHIAQFLSSPPSSPTSSPSSPADDGSLPETRGPSARTFAPLRVIYELDGSNPTFDVDTSQPPDLISDFLSDYDCFSDSDLDDLDMLSQREVQVQDGAANPSSDAWVVLGDDS